MTVTTVATRLPQVHRSRTGQAFAASGHGRWGWRYAFFGDHHYGIEGDGAGIWNNGGTRMLDALSNYVLCVTGESAR